MLFGAGRLPKDHPRVEAFGAVDELNSALGVAISFLPARARLFVGADAKIAVLEGLIDEYDAKVPPLRTFILPSGSQAGAMLHLCRTVCRRAERAVVRLSHEEAVNPDAMRYLNRLSDLLFVLARHVNKAAGKPETQWRKG